VFARIGTIQATPERLDAAIRQIREQAPNVQRMKGHRDGGRVLFDRKSGKLVTLTFWETEADVRAADAAAGEVREKVAQAAGATLAGATEVLEAPLLQGASARVTEVQGRPGQGLSPELQERGLAAARKQSGFRALYVLTDQRTGKFLVMTLWETEEQALAREEAAAPLRREALTTMGITAAPNAEVYEVAVQV
jgi:heme-degrading monooxygenase HmoA